MQAGPVGGGGNHTNAHLQAVSGDAPVVEGVGGLGVHGERGRVIGKSLDKLTKLRVRRTTRLRHSYGGLCCKAR
jgi:hypothetical protein